MYQGLLAAKRATFYSNHFEMTGLGKMPKKGQKMAKFGFLGYNFGTDGPRDLKFGLLASPEDGLPQTRTISDILDFGPCPTCCGIVSTRLNLISNFVVLRLWDHHPNPCLMAHLLALLMHE